MKLANGKQEAVTKVKVISADICVIGEVDSFPTLENHITHIVIGEI